MNMDILLFTILIEQRHKFMKQIDSCPSKCYGDNMLKFKANEMNNRVSDKRIIASPILMQMY